MNEYHYERYHIPSGELSRGMIQCRDYNDFLKVLANWNRSAFTLWQYAAVSS